MKIVHNYLPTLMACLPEILGTAKLSMNYLSCWVIVGECDFFGETCKYLCVRLNWAWVSLEGEGFQPHILDWASTRPEHFGYSLRGSIVVVSQKKRCVFLWLVIVAQTSKMKQYVNEWCKGCCPSGALWERWFFWICVNENILIELDQPIVPTEPKFL